MKYWTNCSLNWQKKHVKTRKLFFSKRRPIVNSVKWAITKQKQVMAIWTFPRELQLLKRGLKPDLRRCVCKCHVVVRQKTF